jgi:CBS domain-containing protein
VGNFGKDLYQPIKSFLNIRGDMNDRVLMGNLPKYEPVTINMNDKFGDVLKTVMEKRVHRVYIVDNDRKPTGVVSLRDLLARILERMQ